MMSVTSFTFTDCSTREAQTRDCLTIRGGIVCFKSTFKYMYIVQIELKLCLTSTCLKICIFRPQL